MQGESARVKMQRRIRDDIMPIQLREPVQCSSVRMRSLGNTQTQTNKQKHANIITNSLSLNIDPIFIIVYNIDNSARVCVKGRLEKGEGGR